MSALQKPRRFIAVKTSSSGSFTRPASLPLATKPASVPRPAAHPRPPSATRQPSFIRKQSAEKTCGGAVKLPQLLVKASPGDCARLPQPFSPFFGKGEKAVLLDAEEICLPYELEECAKPRFIKKPIQKRCVNNAAPKQVNVSILSDLDCGDAPSTNASFMERPIDSRSASPLRTHRSRKLRQLSRHFVLCRRELEVQVADTQETEPDYGSQLRFLSDLEDVLRVPSADIHPPKSALLIKQPRRLY